MLKRIIIKNFKGIKSLDMEFNDIRTILVGNNGVGKSTIIEALRLALSGENSVELTLFSFHKSCWSVTDRAISNLPKIEIEVYFSDIVKGPDFRGKSNLLIEEHPGIRFTYEFDEAYEDLYSHTTHDYVPCEYYHTTRFWFSGQPAKTKLLPFKLFIIDSANTFFNSRPRQFMSRLLEDDTDDFRPKLLSCLAGMRDSFEKNDKVKCINEELSQRAGKIKKELGVSIDLVSKNSYFSVLSPMLDGIPFEFAGLGEQCIVKTLLSLGDDDSGKPRILIVEEPETHLSHTMMYNLMKLLEEKVQSQIIISTHSSFVANRMELDNLVVLSKGEDGTVYSKNLQKDLKDKEYNFFFKATDFATLRLILCKAAILVEGPTDEIVCNYYMKQTNRDMYHNGIELMAVGGVSFGHFVELSKDLKIKVAIVRDRDDKSRDYYEKLYFANSPVDNIRIFLDDNNHTIEPSFVAANKDKLHDLSSTVRKKRNSDETTDTLIDFMSNNKTEWAYRLIQCSQQFEVPQYIKDAFEWIDGK